MPRPHGVGDPPGLTPLTMLGHVPLGLLDAELGCAQEPALRILISKELARKVSHPDYPSGTFWISGREVAIEISALAQVVRTPKGTRRTMTPPAGTAWKIRCEVKIDDQPEAIAPEAFATMMTMPKIDWPPHMCFELTAKGIEAAESLYQRKEEAKSTGPGGDLFKLAVIAKRIRKDKSTVSKQFKEHNIFPAIAANKSGDAGLYEWETARKACSTIWGRDIGGPPTD